MATLQRSIYLILFYLAIPVIFLRLWLKGRKLPAYRKRWKERLGKMSFQPISNTIWIHAVSVGESMAAIPLVNAIKKTFPDYPIIFTCTTPTASELVKKRLNNVHHAYLPYDLPPFIQRFLNHIKPMLVIFFEKELWPNFLAKLKQQKIRVLIANACLSERSTKRYAHIRALSQAMMTCICRVEAQSQFDKNRFMALGMPEARIEIAGNLKFDVNVPLTQIQAGQKWRQTWENPTRPVWIAASTHRGEEQIILESFHHILDVFPESLLLLVPRHPQRFDEVASLCDSHHFNFIKRSQNLTCLNAHQLILGDTMGELITYYAAADVAFVGGSLTSIGGHNLLEPAALSLPIITGSYTHHFIQIVKLLNGQNAINIAQDSASIAKLVVNFFTHPKLGKTEGERAYNVMQANRGALERHLNAVRDCLLGFDGNQALHLSPCGRGRRAQRGG